MITYEKTTASITGLEEICPGTTQKWIKDGAMLVDVREQNEVDDISFDVPKLLHIPLSEFDDRFSEIPSNQKVILVCKVGQRSLRATNYLINKGYDSNKVVNMKYGLERWIQKGYPIKGDAELLNDNSSGCCSSNSCC